MPLTATVCALNSFSSTTVITAQSSFPPKRNLLISSSSHIFSRRDIALLSLLSLSATASAVEFGICKQPRPVSSISNTNPNFLNLFFSSFSRTKGLAKRTKEEILQVSTSSRRRFPRNPSLGLSLSQYEFSFSRIFSLHIASYLILVCFGSF